jgi:hypothetical protein
MAPEPSGLRGAPPTPLRQHLHDLGRGDPQPGEISNRPITLAEVPVEYGAIEESARMRRFQS